jgi:hypothetical protein
LVFAHVLENVSDFYKAQFFINKQIKTPVNTVVKVATNIKEKSKELLILTKALQKVDSFVVLCFMKYETLPVSKIWNVWKIISHHN